MFGVVQVIHDLGRHLGQFWRKLGPLRIGGYLGQGDFGMHAGQAGFILPGPKKSHLQAFWLGIKTENQVMAADLGLNFSV